MRRPRKDRHAAIEGGAGGTNCRQLRRKSTFVHWGVMRRELHAKAGPAGNSTVAGRVAASGFAALDASLMKSEGLQAELTLRNIKVTQTLVVKEILPIRADSALELS